MREDSSVELRESTPLEVNVYRSPRDGRLVVDVDTVGLEGPDKVIRINLNDGPIWNGDPEIGNAVKPVIVMRDGETFESPDVDVIDVTTIYQFDRGDSRSEWTDEDVIGVIRRLEEAGWDDTAGDIIEHWFGEEGVPR